MRLRARGPKPELQKRRFFEEFLNGRRDDRETPAQERQRIEGSKPEVKKLARKANRVLRSLDVNGKLWKTGPLLVASSVPHHVFETLAEGECFNVRIEHRGGSLYCVGDGSQLHAAAMFWFCYGATKQLKNLFGPVMTGGKRRIISNGGRVEFAARERQIDFGIYERKGDGTFDDADTVMVAEVSDRNESLENMVEFLEEVTGGGPSNTRIAIGVYFDTRSRSDLRFRVLFKRRGEPMDVKVVTLETEECKVEIDVRELFSEPRILELLPVDSSPKLVFDFLDLRSEVIPALDELTPEQRKRLRRI